VDDSGPKVKAEAPMAETKTSENTAARPEPVPEQPSTAPPGDHSADEEGGDFIARQVLEKDTVFFEG
jgi:hypothetical protein